MKHMQCLQTCKQTAVSAVCRPARLLSQTHSRCRWWSCSRALDHSRVCAAPGTSPFLYLGPKTAQSSAHKPSQVKQGLLSESPHSSPSAGWWCPQWKPGFIENNRTVIQISTGGLFFFLLFIVLFFQTQQAHGHLSGHINIAIILVQATCCNSHKWMNERCLTVLRFYKPPYNPNMILWNYLSQAGLNSRFWWYSVILTLCWPPESDY